MKRIFLIMVLSLNSLNSTSYIPGTADYRPSNPWKWSSWMYEISLSPATAKKYSTLQIELIKAVAKNDLDKAATILKALSSFDKNPAHFYISEIQAQRLGIVDEIYPSATPLLLAKSPEMIKLLIAYGARANACNGEGEFPAQKIAGEIIASQKYTDACNLYESYKLIKLQENILSKNWHHFLDTEKNLFTIACISTVQAFIVGTSIGIREALINKAATTVQAESIKHASNVVVSVATAALWASILYYNRLKDKEETQQQVDLIEKHLATLAK